MSAVRSRDQNARRSCSDLGPRGSDGCWYQHHCNNQEDGARWSRSEESAMHVPPSYFYRSRRCTPMVTCGQPSPEMVRRAAWRGGKAHQHTAVLISPFLWPPSHDLLAVGGDVSGYFCSTPIRPPEPEIVRANRERHLVRWLITHVDAVDPDTAGVGIADYVHATYWRQRVNEGLTRSQSQWESRRAYIEQTRRSNFDPILSRPPAPFSS